MISTDDRQDAVKAKSALDITHKLALARSSYAHLLEKAFATPGGILHARSASKRADRGIRAPAGYVRFELRRGRETVLAVGVSAHEDQQTIDGIIGAGIVWLVSFNSHRPLDERARMLWLLFPHHLAQTLIERLTLITTTHLHAGIECYEVDETDGEIKPILVASQMELASLHPKRLKWPRKSAGDAARSFWRERILQLAPDLIEVRASIDGEGEKYLIHGLEFARWRGQEHPRIFFGVSEWTHLTEDNFESIETLVREIGFYRCGDPPDRRHPFYRLRAEAWLESIMLRDIRAFDPTLDDRFVYSQIPTWRADERSVLDLLAVNRHGRLVVIEIKATEAVNLPLQGIDYWLRVEEARRRKEFKRRGLFPGIDLADSPPILYMVTPRLRFHRTFAEVARCLIPEVEAYRIGLNSNWRTGVRVRVRERVNL